MAKFEVGDDQTLGRTCLVVDASTYHPDLRHIFIQQPCLFCGWLNKSVDLSSENDKFEKKCRNSQGKTERERERVRKRERELYKEREKQTKCVRERERERERDYKNEAKIGHE